MKNKLIGLWAGLLVLGACTPSQGENKNPAPAPADPRQELLKASLPQAPGTLTLTDLQSGAWGPEKLRSGGWLELQGQGQALLKASQDAEAGYPAVWTLNKGYLVVSLQSAPAGTPGLPAAWKSPTQVFTLQEVSDSFYGSRALVSPEVQLFDHKSSVKAVKRLWNGLEVFPSKAKTLKLKTYTGPVLQPGAKEPLSFTLDLFASYQRDHAGEPKIAHVGSSYPLLPPGKWLQVLGERTQAGVRWLLVNTLLKPLDSGPEEAWVPLSAVEPLSPEDFMEVLPTFKDFAFYMLPEGTKKEIDNAQWVVSPMKRRIDGLEALGKKGSPEYKDLYNQLEKALGTLVKLDPRVEN